MIKMVIESFEIYSTAVLQHAAEPITPIRTDPKEPIIKQGGQAIAPITEASPDRIAKVSAQGDKLKTGESSPPVALIIKPAAASEAINDEPINMNCDNGMT